MIAYLIEFGYQDEEGKPKKAAATLLLLFHFVVNVNWFVMCWLHQEKNMKHVST